MKKSFSSDSNFPHSYANGINDSHNGSFSDNNTAVANESGALILINRPDRTIIIAITVGIDAHVHFVCLYHSNNIINGTATIIITIVAI